MVIRDYYLSQEEVEKFAQEVRYHLPAVDPSVSALHLCDILWLTKRLSLSASPSQWCDLPPQRLKVGL
jgi:hypothetical protein